MAFIRVCAITSSEKPSGSSDGARPPNRPRGHAHRDRSHRRRDRRIGVRTVRRELAHAIHRRARALNRLRSKSRNPRYAARKSTPMSVGSAFVTLATCLATNTPRYRRHSSGTSSATSCRDCAGGRSQQMTWNLAPTSPRSSASLATASSASSNLAPSGPPAWAMSGRPPPPLPPSAAEPAARDRPR